MQDDTTAAPGSDPETEAALTRAVVEGPLAWSVDDGDEETLPYHDDDDSEPPEDTSGPTTTTSAMPGRTVALFVALIGVAVVAAAWAVGVYLTHRAHDPAPAAQQPATTAPDVIVPSTPSAPTGPSLNGAYQLVFDIANATYHGHSTGPKRSGVATIWWAFKSSCTPVGCTASGIKLDNTDHTVASAKNITDTFTFVNGRWEDAPMSSPDTIAPGCTNDQDQWTLTPQPDGTLAGVETVTLEGSCGSAGNATITPFTATRIGGVPAGLLGS